MAELTIESVFEQEQLDKRNLTKRINDLQSDTDIALRKTAELYTSLKVNGLECLTVCEVTQIIDDYFQRMNLEISDIDQDVLGQLTFHVADPDTPPIVVNLCPHTVFCETGTTLSSPGPLQLEYEGEKQTNTLDLSPWFIADNIIWSGTPTGRPQGTVQSIVDEVITELDESIDCTYFTGTVSGLALKLEDLVDVNPTGDTVHMGDYLRFDGNNWQPIQTSYVFDCAELNTCTVNSLSDVSGSPEIGNILIGDGSAWVSSFPSELATTVLSAGNHWAAWTPTAPGDEESFEVSITNTSTKSATFFYTAKAVIVDKRTAGNGAVGEVFIDENGTNVSASTRTYSLGAPTANIEDGTFIQVEPTTRSFTLATGGTMTIRIRVNASTLELSYRDIEIFIYGLTTI
jgi:hypothetical protein